MAAPHLEDAESDPLTNRAPTLTTDDTLSTADPTKAMESHGETKIEFENSPQPPVGVGTPGARAANTTEQTEQSENLSSDVGIILVGKPGAGKRTLMENGLIPLRDPQEVRTAGDKSKWTFNGSEDSQVVYNVQAIEDLELMRTFMKNETRGKQKLSAEYRTKLPRNISLIVFVYKCGRYTHEEKAMFELVIDSLKEQVKSICALVITCCEQMTVDAKENLKAEFRHGEDTHKVANFMGKGIICVGLPDVNKVKPKFREESEEECKTSREKLMKLSPQKGSNSITIDALLIDKPPREYLPCLIL